MKSQTAIAFGGHGCRECGFIPNASADRRYIDKNGRKLNGISWDYIYNVYNCLIGNKNHLMPWTMPMKSQIIIKELKFYGFHGVYAEEQTVGTSFMADIVIDIDSDMQGFVSDQLEDTLNYEKIVETALSICTGQKYRLIEHLAHVLCESFLSFEHVICADVTIYKLVNRLTPEPQWIGIRRQLSR